MIYDGFINVPFSSSNLDRYLLRTSIIQSMNEALPFFTGRMLDVGCGKMPYKKFILDNSLVKVYVGLDIETAFVYDDVKPDIVWDGKAMPIANDSFDSAMATEVLEHCPDPEVLLKEVYRVLKAGGSFFFTVPFLWNLHEVPHDEYRYTPFSLERHIRNSGFRSVQIFAMGGWHASMAQMLGLWVRRAPLPSYLRNSLSILFKPIIKYLIKKDTIVKKNFHDGLMITGLYGWAEK